ncbi:protein ninX [Escherichia coli LAU-EC6]|uniref:phage protein NinX family protein n=7 Tax=Escherichia coli TaxID=562 RepID=UPI0003D3147E|nr:phage protein NinX family protein [Escherichia coli]ETE13740.1 protein ninX [Escherichia coli LAU-EC6]
MDYSQLSDFEINRMVGDIIFKGLWASKPETSGNNTNKWYYGNADTTFEPLNHLPDYCNDPSASWPIIEKYRISILDQLTEWCVDAKGVSPIFDTRPLRAAMKWFTEFGHLNRGDMLTSEQHRCHNEKKKFQRRV